MELNTQRIQEIYRLSKSNIEFSHCLTSTSKLKFIGLLRVSHGNLASKQCWQGRKMETNWKGNTPWGEDKGF